MNKENDYDKRIAFALDRAADGGNKYVYHCAVCGQ